MIIRKPKIDATTPSEQLKQIRSYLFQLADDLENGLSKQSSGGTNLDSSKILAEVQNILMAYRQPKKRVEGITGGGKSAYQIAVDNGFEGSEIEWLFSLQGEDGKDGTNGLTPHIQDGYWYIGQTNTNVKAEGIQGEQGLMAYINAEIVDGELCIDLNTSEEITFEINEQGELVIIYE